jgi:hypothetical protein
VHLGAVALCVPGLSTFGQAGTLTVGIGNRMPKTSCCLD